jgi:hypothetical protein
MLYELGPSGKRPSSHITIYAGTNGQAFASVTSLLSHLERIVNFAVEVDLPTPVSDALLEILYGKDPLNPAIS